MTAELSRNTSSFAQWKELHSEAVFLIDAEGVILDLNQRAETLLTARRTAVQGARLATLLRRPGASDLDPFFRRAARTRTWHPKSAVLAVGPGEGLACTLSAARADRDGCLYVQIVPRSDDPAISRFQQANLRVGEMAVKLEKRRREQALLAGEKAILESVAAGRPLEQALNELLSIIQLHSVCCSASVLLLDADGRRLHTAASSHLSAEYCEAIDGLEIGPAVGACGTAAFTQETVITRDIMTDPKWVPFRDLAKREGVRACWSVPLVSAGVGVLGTFALYYADVREPSEDERMVVDKAANIARIAIARSRYQRERAKLLKEARRGRKAAEAASAAKDQFLAMLGHELRNPLGAMVMAAQVLHAEEPDEEERNRLQEVILRQGHHLARILEDLLDVTRLDSGKLVLNPEVVALHEACALCVRDLEGLGTRRGIRFELDVEEAFVRADPTRIEQILRNLIENSVKYGRDGGCTRLTVRRKGEQAIVSVTDDGVGMTPTLLDQAFEPFTQAPQSIRRGVGGVGLGLPVVKRLVELHGGSIEIVSEGEGRGTRVAFRLPAVAAPAPAREAAPVRPPAKGFDGLRVLVVEDHADARRSLVRLLRRWGCETVVAEDGRVGLDLARAHEPSIALVDIGLPGLDGYALARAIRAAETSDRMRLIAMTGYGQTSDRQRALDAGFDAHLVKPVELDALRGVLAST